MSYFLLDDFSRAESSQFGTTWFAFSDQVMGGGSQIFTQYIQNTDAYLSVSGEVTSPDGFIQVALSLVHSRYLFDARHFKGVQLVCRSSQPQGYAVHLRSKELSMPWQHYRMPLLPTPQWKTHQLPFDAFVPMYTGHELNVERLNRIGIVAGLKAFHVDLDVAEIGFYV